MEAPYDSTLIIMIDKAISKMSTVTLKKSFFKLRQLGIESTGESYCVAGADWPLGHLDNARGGPVGLRSIFPIAGVIRSGAELTLTETHHVSHIINIYNR